MQIWGRLRFWEPHFSRFHAIFQKILQNSMLAPPPGRFALMENLGSAAA